MEFDCTKEIDIRIHIQAKRIYRANLKTKDRSIAIDGDRDDLRTPSAHQKSLEEQQQGVELMLSARARSCTIKIRVSIRDMIPSRH